MPILHLIMQYGSPFGQGHFLKALFLALYTIERTIAEYGMKNWHWPRWPVPTLHLIMQCGSPFGQGHFLKALFLAPTLKEP